MAFRFTSAKAYVNNRRCGCSTVYTLTLKRTIAHRFKDEAAAKAADAKLPATQVISNTKVLSLAQMDGNVASLTSALSKPVSVDESIPNQQQQAQQIEGLWNTISGRLDYNPFGVSDTALVATNEVYLASNTSTVETMVDYSRTYYYNSPRPWVGSSKIDAKLAADGTLTEGSAENQTQTLSTFVSALPISGVLTKVAELGLGTPVTGAIPGAKPVEIIRTVTFELTIQQQAYRHTHSRYVPFTNPCPVVAEGVTCPSGTGAGACPPYSTQVEPVDNAPAKDDSNSVKVNGTISLPKPDSKPQ
jgi:hypothetical protein